MTSPLAWRYRAVRGQEKPSRIGANRPYPPSIATARARRAYAVGLSVWFAVATLASAPASAEPGRDAVGEEKAIHVQGGHVLFRVPPNAIPETVTAFEQAGFTVTLGGPEHDLVNAMIHLSDGWFIELFGLGREPRVARRLALARVFAPIAWARFDRLVRSEPGVLVDWSIDVDNISLARDKLRAIGLRVSKPRTLHRMQPDGTVTSWELSLPDALDVPFLKSPYRDHIPIPDRVRHHANGASRLARIDLGVPDIAEVREHLCALVGLEPGGEGPIELGGVEIHLSYRSSFAILSIVLEAETNSSGAIVVEDRPTGILLVQEP